MLKLLGFLATLQVVIGFTFPRYRRRIIFHSRVASLAQPSDSQQASEDGDLANMTAAEIDALPTINELLASGAAQRVVFQGDELSTRFHWKTRALAGEFSQALAPEADTEANSEGSIEAALLSYPAQVTLTIVGKLSVNANFLGEVTSAVKSLAGEEVSIVAKERNQGEDTSRGNE